jgi:sporulation protein YlmC with PRC-barrel domain
MSNLEEVQAWRGRKVVDADGDKIGTIEDVFLDRHTGEPEWATVKTGLFGLKSSFVPIRDAQVTDEDEVRVPLKKEQVKDAPKIDADGELSPDQERQLWEYYGRFDYDEWQGEDRTAELGLPDDREGRFERSGDTDVANETAPAIVGVRLRRVIVVAPSPSAPDPDQTAPHRG